MGMLIQGVLVFLGTIFAAWLLGVFHVVDEGHIGVYKRGGALLNTWTEPGLHYMAPLLTTMHQVQITLQTDQVTDIPCGTSSGVMITFEKIEVVNRLKKNLAYDTIKNYTVSYDQTWIFSKIHHEINQFCSSHTLQEVLIDNFDQLDESLKEALQAGCKQWAPGIEIIAVRVTKPKVPASISENYENREVEKTKLLIIKEQQKVKEKEAETEKLIQKLNAESQTKIGQITNKQNLAEKEAKKKIYQIENKILTVKEEAQAEAVKYRKEKEIAINQKRMTPEYILYTEFENIKGTQKTYYGPSVADYLSNVESLIERKVNKQDRKQAKQTKEAKDKK